MTTQLISDVSVPSKMTNERTQTSIVNRILTIASSLDHVGMGLLCMGLVIVLLWIGGLKFASYEADSIVPLVASSPLTSFLYRHPAPAYKHYMNKEGELTPIESGTGPTEPIRSPTVLASLLCRSAFSSPCIRLSPNFGLWEVFY